MHQVDIANEQELLEPDTDYLRDVVTHVLTTEQVASSEISIALVDDPQIHELNRAYLNHDYETDVLSFLLEETLPVAGTITGDQSSTIRRGQGKQIVGEVIVSTETAIRDASQFGWRPIDELTLYLIHGVLHLVGYDDLSDDERDIMRTREKEMLTHWQLTPVNTPEAINTQSQSLSDATKEDL